jgi:hypothetical protein
MAAKRFDVNGPMPTGANDLSQSLRVVLICLIDLHLKSGTRMPGVKTHNFEAEIAEFMNEPWRHCSSFDSYAGVVSCMSTHHSIDLFRNGRALATPQPPTGIVDHADGGHLLRNIQASKTGHQSASDCANHRATLPGSRHYRRITRRPRLSDVQTCQCPRDAFSHLRNALLKSDAEDSATDPNLLIKSLSSGIHRRRLYTRRHNPCIQ